MYTVLSTFWDVDLGDGLAVLGFVLDSSPSSALAVLLVSVGLLTACSAAIGCCASNGNRCCLRSYLILSTIAFLLQVSFCLFNFYPELHLTGYGPPWAVCFLG